MFYPVNGRACIFALAVLIHASVFNSLPLPAQTPATAEVPTTSSHIASPSVAYQFPNGKKFLYTVEWHSLNAGTATIRIDPDGSEEKLTATAATSGAVNFLFPVRSWFEAHIASKTFCSSRIFKHSEEGKRKKETQIQFDSARGKSIFDEKNLKTGETRHEEDDAPSCATDILSGFFYLGSLPLRGGSVETFPVVDGGRTSTVQAQVEATEEIKVPAGDFHAIRVALNPVSGKFQGKGEIWVWYTDDAARTPLQMKARLQWGTVMFKLQRIE